MTWRRYQRSLGRPHPLTRPRIHLELVPLPPARKELPKWAQYSLALCSLVIPLGVVMWLLTMVVK